MEWPCGNCKTKHIYCDPCDKKTAWQDSKKEVSIPVFNAVCAIYSFRLSDEEREKIVRKATE